jgi:hypothetical protein
MGGKVCMRLPVANDPCSAKEVAQRTAKATGLTDPAIKRQRWCRDGARPSRKFYPLASVKLMRATAVVKSDGGERCGKVET